MSTEREINQLEAAQAMGTVRTVAVIASCSVIFERMIGEDMEWEWEVWGNRGQQRCPC